MVQVRERGDLSKMSGWALLLLTAGETGKSMLPWEAEIKGSDVK